MGEDNVYTPTGFPLFRVVKVGGKHFLAVRKTDTEGSAFHVVGIDGANYGSWGTVETFVDSLKRASLPPNEQCLVAVPLGNAMLSVRAV